MHLDVLVVGAGLSGITAAYRLQSECPQKRFWVVEARNAVGGTWDLFRYPGIRSDSDMYTFGFAFEPWTGEQTVAQGETIRNYIQDTAEKHGLNRHIRFGHRLRKAAWSSDQAVWTVELEQRENTTTLTCQFLWMCTGYYDYHQGYTPPLPGLENFQGKVIHPQEWPEDFDYTGSRIVVIGSGATAVTLIPKLAQKAEHVTMLQRSPSYIAELPARDPWVSRLKRLFPPALAHWLLRWKGILYQTFVFQFARKWPQRMKKILLSGLPKHFSSAEIQKHFTPRYNPWEQRLCLDSDGEFFSALRTAKASVVTDKIETFTENSLLLQSGTELPADIVVTATGLVVKLFGNARLLVDDRPVDPSQHLVYKGTMLSDVPNMWFALGYTNMSWTLKCDLSARYVCRLLTFMDQKGHRICAPRVQDPKVEAERLLDFSSGYLQRANDILPKQGSKQPWRLHQSYLHDLVQTELGSLNDEVMEFRP
jgi:monooxygenase